MVKTTHLNSSILHTSNGATKEQQLYKQLAIHGLLCVVSEKEV